METTHFVTGGKKYVCIHDDKPQEDDGSPLTLDMWIKILEDLKAKWGGDARYSIDCWDEISEIIIEEEKYNKSISSGT